MKSRFLSAVLVAALLALTPVPSSSASASPDAPAPEPPNVTVTVEPLPEITRPVEPSRSPSATTSAAGLPLPALSSRPTSTHTVFLDFDGLTLPASSAWTTGSSNIDAGTYTGYSLDADPDFSQTEVDNITKIWRIVAEKYSVYDVNVTTVDPGQAALTRTNSGDVTYGVQVVMTDDPSPRSQICSNTCAGIAYNDLFDGRQQNPDPGDPAGCLSVCNTADYTIAWVFTAVLSGIAQMAATDAAHEIGHTMGLGHDGGSANPSYYSGHGPSGTGGAENDLWVPIMGITNQNAISQFSKGEYTGATSAQDDLLVLSTNGNAGSNGSFTLPDDFTTSSGAPTGTAVLGNQTSYTVNGIITNAADDDLFSISRTCTSALTASAAGIGAGQSVDLRVEIQNAAGGVLAFNDPAAGYAYVPASSAYEPTGVNASATLGSTTAATTYRIKVDGVGSGNPANTGYSDYGSIGPYTLTISGCPSDGSTIPGPPATASASPNARTTTGTVNWSVPSSNGGSAITGYSITGLPGGTKTPGNVLTYPATGLTPGVTYNVGVFAINANGTSATSANTTLKVDTWAPTTKPTLTANLSGSTASLSWTAPPNPGGATLIGWHVVGTGASPVDENLPAATLSKGYPVDFGTTSYTVTGIYTATDTAGVVASDSKSVTRSVTAPGAPASASAKSATNGRSGTITWTAPSNNGGSAVTGYTVAGLPGGTRTLGNVLSSAATGLTPAKSYVVVIRATNSIGAGASRSVTLKTFGVPSAPRIGTPSSGKAGGTKNATARWAAPTSTGGTAIKSYKVVAYKIVGGKITRTYVSKTLSSSARAFVFALPGGSYRFKVVAYNAVGASTGSAYSKVVTSR